MTENQLHVKPKLKFMIRKKLMMAVAMTAATFFSSCTEEHDLGGDLLSKQTIVAEMAEMSDAPQSRTCVDVKNPSTSFVGLLWQVADKLGVFNQNGAGNAQFSNTSTENAPKAGFSGELSGEAKYAYFPYSENAGNSANSIKGAILAEQPFDPESGSLVCDYKVGQLTSVSEGVSYFSFKQLMTMLRITLDASETSLEGERLNNIILTVTDKDGKACNICGDFTFDATKMDGNCTIGSINLSNKVSMPWTTRPTLGKNKSFQGFISILPGVVMAGDKLTIEVVSEKHKATFTVDCITNLLQGFIYNVPLKLKEFKDKLQEGFKEEEVQTVPTITSFKFKVGDKNPNLIDNKLVWTSKNTPSFSSVSELTAEVNEANHEITLCIPYLYDFKLKPTIVSSTGIVKVNGVEHKDGETEVDFTRPVIYTVYNSDGYSQDYTVKVTNTGLPVVVIKQSESGSYADDVATKRTGFLSWEDRVLNEFVNFNIRAKGTDWVKDDQITIYNADGTVDCEVKGGVRLRGNTTQDYPKKPLAIKFNEEKSVLGMPAHKRWVLLANWLDHSMIRNTVAFDIAHVIEYTWRNNSTIDPGIPWCPSGQNVELVISDNEGKYHHVGNYFLGEQIKIGENRLNIKKEFNIDKPGANDYTQYGFLIEGVTKDKMDEPSNLITKNGIRFQFKDSLNATIRKQVTEKIQRIETNIVGGNYSEAYKELDICSLIDQMLIWELTLNREYGDPSSVYMYMDGDGKLSAGPVWDFDRGTFQNQQKAGDLGNDDRIKPNNKWMYWRKNSSESYIWYSQLTKDPNFQAEVQKRWEAMKNIGLKEIISNQIRAYGEKLKVSWDYNYEMWPTTEKAVQRWKYGFDDWSGDETLTTFEEVIENMVTVFEARFDGMDGLITSGKFTE